jgi:cytochrome c biogenesis protein
VGLVMGFYWQHRRIWLRYEDGRIFLAAHTNKNWFGLKKEIERVAVDTSLNISLELIDQGGKKK